MSEKIILAVVSPEETDNVTAALLAQHFEVTQLSSMGGFLRRGSATLIVGVDEADLADALAVIRAAPKGPPPTDAHRVTLFVLNAEGYEKV